VQKKRFEELERKRKEEILQKMKVDHDLSKEIVMIMKNSVATGSAKKSGSSSRDRGRGLVRIFRTCNLCISK
jgi:hypothetical protein